MMNDVMNNDRFDRLMARVDAWAEEDAGWDCREDAAYELDYTLNCADCADWDDDAHVDNAIAAWRMAE